MKNVLSSVNFYINVKDYNHYLYERKEIAYFMSGFGN